MRVALQRMFKVCIFIAVLIGIGAKFILICANIAPENVAVATGENEVIALNYHYIREENMWNKSLENITQCKELTTYSVYEDEFRRQIETLIEQDAYFATLEEVNHFRTTGEFPEKCVWISFDDADISVYERAYPILKEHQIPFTMFVIAGHVGNKDFNNLEICSWDQLKEMRDSGLASFGSHTYDMHYLEEGKAMFLHEHNYKDFYEDLKKSKKVLEKELEVPINSIAYPFGQSSEDLAHIVEQAGYETAYILAPVPINEYSSAYCQSRYLVSKRNFDKIGLNNLDANKTTD